MPISVHVRVVQKNNTMDNSFCSYMSFIQNIFSTLHAVYECNITRIVITYKPVFQTRFKLLADSLFLWQTQDRRFTTSTVTINNVSVRTILCGTIIMRLEKENKTCQCNNPLTQSPGCDQDYCIIQ